MNLSLPLLETIRDVFCYGDVLLHIQGQQINLTLETCCDVFHEKVHIIASQVVEDDNNRPRVSKIRVTVLISRSPVRS